MHAPTHNGLKCKWQFYTLCFVCLFLMFCFARCIRWRFGLLAPNMRATVYVFERVRSPGVLAVCFCYAFAIYFGLMFTFGSFYVLCVFYSHAILCSRGLNLSFLHRFFLSFFLLNTNLLCLHWVLKTFTSSLIVYQLFFLLFLLIGFNIISFFRLDSSRIWFFFHFFSRVKITVSFALRALGVNFCVVASCKWIVSFDSQIGDLLLFLGLWNESLLVKSVMEWFVPTFRCIALGVFVCFVLCVSLLFSFCLWMIIE